METMMHQKHDYVSLSTAAKELGINRQELKGYLKAIGVQLLPIGKILAVRRIDLIRVILPPNDSQTT
jgi:hypothetical protein